MDQDNYIKMLTSILIQNDKKKTKKIYDEIKQGKKKINKSREDNSLEKVNYNNTINKLLEEDNEKIKKENISLHNKCTSLELENINLKSDNANYQLSYTKLLNENQKLKELNKDLVEQNLELNNEKVKLKDFILNLEKANKHIDIKYDNLKNKFDNIEEDNINLKSFIIDQKKTINLLKSINQKMINDMSSLKNKMNNINIKTHLYFKKKIDTKEKIIVKLNNKITKMNYENNFLHNKIHHKHCKKNTSSSYDIKSSSDEFNCSSAKSSDESDC